MNISLCDIPIELKTDLASVNKEWRSIFSLHQIDPVNPKIVIKALPIDAAPEYDPSLSIRMFNDGVNAYSLAYSSDGPSILTLANGAIIGIPNVYLSSIKEETCYVAVYLPEQAISHKQIEDIMLTALAPMLRRLGVYIAHAFGVAHPNMAESVLIIGPSGSGKTTTGLAFIQHGWRYLGNDAVFLSENDAGEIVAWPSPGNLNISPHTFELVCLPELSENGAAVEQDGKHHFSPDALSNISQNPVKVTAQLFPSIVPQGHVSEAVRIPAGVALSQLMAQSIDNWDSATFESHFAFLERLTRQSRNIQTRNTADLSSVISAINGALFPDG